MGRAIEEGQDGQRGRAKVDKERGMGAITDMWEDERAREIGREQEGTKRAW